MSSQSDLPTFFEIDWSTLPVPQDDGAANHLLGFRLPSLQLLTTNGDAVDFSAVLGRIVVYCYPMTGKPGTPLPGGWDMIPGARGCTPQSCSFRDHADELKKLGVDHIFGLSTQDTDYQCEAAARLHLPFPLVSDHNSDLTRAIKLPTFETSGMVLLKRLTMIIRDGVVEKVFYPVFPPDRNALEVIDWLTVNQSLDPSYLHLGPFSGLVAAARQNRPLFGKAVPGPQTRQKVRELLNFSIDQEMPGDPIVGHRWSNDGVDGEIVSWSVGFGPRTEAIFLKPTDATGPLPGVLALHDHGYYKYFGKEKIANGPNGPVAELSAFRRTYYEGRAFANALTQRGFAVLVPDTFLWGSRRFPLEVMPEFDQRLAEDTGRLLAQAGPAVSRYNGAAYHHEHHISKYCMLLGTSFAGVVAYEDRVALNYLKTRSDVDSSRTACIGLSGGGSRAALLRATSEDLKATVIAGMMSTYEELLDHLIAPHTWMLFPDGWSSHADWPDLAASGAPAPLLVQYLLEDQFFTVKGMRDADAKLAAAYADLAAPGAYTGAFFPGPHRFDIAMQEQAFDWLAQHLGPIGAA